jgi:hypothetical protein
VFFKLRFPKLETPYSARVNAIVDQLRSQRPAWMNVHVVKEGEPREIKFFNALVEDKTKMAHSYYEFLTNLHQRIQAKVSKK